MLCPVLRTRRTRNTRERAERANAPRTQRANAHTASAVVVESLAELTKLTCHWLLLVSTRHTTQKTKRGFWKLKKHAECCCIKIQTRCMLHHGLYILFSGVDVSCHPSYRWPLPTCMIWSASQDRYTPDYVHSSSFCPVGAVIICMIYRMIHHRLPVQDLYYTDPAQHLITAGLRSSGSRSYIAFKRWKWSKYSDVATPKALVGRQNIRIIILWFKMFRSSRCWNTTWYTPRSIYRYQIFHRLDRHNVILSI